MVSLKSLALKSSLFAVLSLFSLAASAGTPGQIPTGNMDFHIDPAAIPTLSATMLIVLSLLLFAVAVRVAKQKNSSTGKLFLAIIGVTSLSMGTGGLKLISDVEAGAAVQQTITLHTSPGSTSGQVGLFGGQGFVNYFDNEYSVDVTIDRITAFPGFNCDLYSPPAVTRTASRQDADPGSPMCSEVDGNPGNIIPPGGQCHVFCFSDSMDGG